MAEYKHGEAFKLMQYSCRECPHFEIIWNSRDGVTPFMLGCPSCGNISLQHVSWQDDVTAPDHKPHPGQRFFRDGTKQEARDIISRRAENWPADPSWPVGMTERMHLEIEDGTHSEFPKGWPTVVRQPDIGK